MQLVPLVSLALGLVALGWLVLRPRAASLLVFRCVMAGFVASGLVGVYLHYRANVEFELEMYPTLSGLELVREALTGAMPALAPGTMTLLGVLGLLSTYRLPEGGFR